MSRASDDHQFATDIYRAIILGKMISAWGVPESRRTLSNDEGTVEIYRIPSDTSEGLVRYATFGLSRSRRKDRSLGSHEMLFVNDESSSQEAPLRAFEFMCELSAYYLNTSHAIELPSLIPSSPLVPWNPKALLLDEARGEDEDVANIVIGSRPIQLIWLVPIFDSEYELIERTGIEEFDRRVETRNVELVDMNRDPVA